MFIYLQIFPQGTNYANSREFKSSESSSSDMFRFLRIRLRSKQNLAFCQKKHIILQYLFTQPFRKYKMLFKKKYIFFLILRNQNPQNQTLQNRNQIILVGNYEIRCMYINFLNFCITEDIAGKSLEVFELVDGRLY